MKNRQTYQPILLFSAMAAILLLTVIGCDHRNPLYFDEGQDFVVLHYGESKTGDITQLEIGFNRVVSDSRCPNGERCFWEGKAEIEIWIHPRNRDITFINLPLTGYTFAQDSMRHVGVDTLGYSFALVELNPYPEFKNTIEDSDYEAKIMFQVLD